MASRSEGNSGVRCMAIRREEFLERFLDRRFREFGVWSSGPEYGSGEKNTWISPMISFSDLSNSFPGSATPATPHPLSMRETDQTLEIVSMHETSPEQDSVSEQAHTFQGPHRSSRATFAKPTPVVCQQIQSPPTNSASSAQVRPLLAEIFNIFG